jgi:hypothetical protein
MGLHPRRRSVQLDQIVKVDVRSMNGTAGISRLITQPQEDDYFFNSLLDQDDCPAHGRATSLPQVSPIQCPCGCAGIMLHEQNGYAIWPFTYNPIGPFRG